MFDKITTKLFGDDDEHPLELEKEEHRKKEIVLNDKQKQLRDRADNLETKLATTKEKYTNERDQGNETAAERLLRDAEDIKDELETVQTKLNAVDQMLNTVRNFQNVYELRELGEEEYWKRIRKMDRTELVELFSKEQREVEDMLSSLSDIGTVSRSTISDLNRESDQLHAGSSLNWDEEYGQEDSNTTPEEPNVFSADARDTDPDGQDFDDLNLN